MPLARSHWSSPALATIERPHCPSCETRMNLSRITPGPQGYDFRNFACERCGQVETRMICNDPMTSGAANWINSDLKPPK
jgi:hypothetical protein